MTKISDESIQKMKELIEIAREKGKVIHFTDAFDKYPAENEVHEGQMKYWTQGENNNGI